tara:strand:+ start:528 stop:917 length:390 start_codon:yes stop_codon:yes gene_type:complete
MTTKANWTIVFEDNVVIKNHAEGASQGIGYVISDDAFWATTDFQNIWAIQAGTSNSSDEVEHRDETPHCSLTDKGIDIQQFVDRWDAAHLSKLQANWDNNNAVDENGDSTETEAEKIARLGARPTSYSS